MQSSKGIGDWNRCGSKCRLLFHRDVTPTGSDNCFSWCHVFFLLWFLLRGCWFHWIGWCVGSIWRLQRWNDRKDDAPFIGLYVVCLHILLLLLLLKITIIHIVDVEIQTRRGCRVGALLLPWRDLCCDGSFRTYVGQRNTPLVYGECIVAALRRCHDTPQGRERGEGERENGWMR